MKFFFFMPISLNNNKFLIDLKTEKNICLNTLKKSIRLLLFLCGVIRFTLYIMYLIPKKAIHQI